MEKSNNRNNKAIIISLIVVIVFILCAGVTVGFIMNNNSTYQQEIQQQGVVFDSNASHYDGTVESNNSDSRIKIPGYPDITFTSDSTDFPITLLNPEGNPCNFKFSLSLKETGEILYTTDLVKSGDAINGVELEHTLDKGIYTLLINISTYDVESGGEMNGAQVQTKLIIE